jgi:hypothetical protein
MVADLLAPDHGSGHVAWWLVERRSGCVHGSASAAPITCEEQRRLWPGPWPSLGVAPTRRWPATLRSRLRAWYPRERRKHPPRACCKGLRLQIGPPSTRRVAPLAEPRARGDELRTLRRARGGESRPRRHRRLMSEGGCPASFSLVGLQAVPWRVSAQRWRVPSAPRLGGIEGSSRPGPRLALSPPRWPCGALRRGWCRNRPHADERASRSPRILARRLHHPAHVGHATGTA